MRQSINDRALHYGFSLRTYAFCLRFLHSCIVSAQQWLRQVFVQLWDVFSMQWIQLLLVSNVTPPFPWKVNVCVQQRVSGWESEPGDSLEEPENGNKQMELRFMWPDALRSAHGLDLGTIGSFRDMGMQLYCSEKAMLYAQAGQNPNTNTFYLVYAKCVVLGNVLIT